jgi:uncharacterized protein (TIGR02452 family)
MRPEVFRPKIQRQSSARKAIRARASGSSRSDRAGRRPRPRSCRRLGNSLVLSGRRAHRERAMSARLRGIARETVEILERGRYRHPGGAEVPIDASSAVAGTRLYLPDDRLPSADPSSRPAPTVEVTDESTLQAARRLGEGVAALVFASARHPGGGFLNGAQAQEESIARGSALYPCLRAAAPFYAYHRSRPELTYSDRIIYSPRVPVFRDDRGRLLAAPYEVTFLTAAAPNVSAIRRTQPERIVDVPDVLRRRAARILAVAAAHGHDRLVLGAWGCGVFGNDPAEVAAAFAVALPDSRMERVVFAILGSTPREVFIRVTSSTTSRVGRDGGGGETGGAGADPGETGRC